MPFLGEAIALATVLCWTFSVQFFAAASKQVGAVPVNIIRICIIPFSIYLHKEHVSLRAVGGAVVAVFGVYLLMA
jgi:drug/metabolite transporter (DMT)-like permease